VKRGDLVKWNHPTKEPAYGVIVGIWKACEGGVEKVDIAWTDGEGNGPYPKDHEYLELVSESR